MELRLSSLPTLCPPALHYWPETLCSTWAAAPHGRTPENRPSRSQKESQAQLFMIKTHCKMVHYTGFTQLGQEKEQPSAKDLPLLGYYGGDLPSFSSLT